MRPEVSKIINGKRVIVKKPELLAPAGDLEKLKIAIRYGADAVFIGGQEFSLRSSAKNFTFEKMAEAVEFAREHNARVYVTTNIIAHDDNLEGLEEYLCKLEEIGIWGIIAADPAIMLTARQVAPKLEVHISTQQSVSNHLAAKYWEDLGMERVVLARECGKEEMQEILDKTDIEVEVFVHGAMCIAYSGRCGLSNHLTNRDANRGGCSQSCRWQYDFLQGEKKINTDDKDAYAMSAKDLVLINKIPDLIEMGVDSLKVEGRMKSIHYIATIIGTYRKLIDAYCENPDGFELSPWYREELEKAANRPSAEQFFDTMPDNNEQLYYRNEHPSQEFIGIVLDYDNESGVATIEQRNHFRLGQRIEVFGPNKDNFEFVVEEMRNEDGELIDVAQHPRMIVKMSVPFPVQSYDMIRKVK